MVFNFTEYLSYCAAKRNFALDLVPQLVDALSSTGGAFKTPVDLGIYFYNHQRVGKFCKAHGISGPALDLLLFAAQVERTSRVL